MESKTALITGATGMVGSIVLRECFNSPEISKIIHIGRRSIGIEHKKLKEVIHSDFLDFESIKENLKGIDIVYYCIGVYTGQVPKEEFKKITYDFTIAFADALKKESPNAKFCFLSGQGADQKEKSRISFAKYKGMAENHLIKSDFDQLTIFRPGYIYPVEKRKEPNFSYRLSRRLYPLLKRLYSNGVITSEQLGKAIFKAGLVDLNEVVYKNPEIKKII